MAAMTDETRETLTAMLKRAEQKLAGAAQPSLSWIWQSKRVAALRDVLTPRTCGTCRHSVEHRRWNDGGVFLTCEHLGSLACCNKVRPDDGCIKGWQAREGDA